VTLADQPVDVSIVMPCLNEAATIGQCVDVAHDSLKMLFTTYGLTGEVVVADNGSSDGSQDIASGKGARVIDVPERGYGAALRGGFAAAHGRYLVMGDSDMSYDFRDAVPMIAKLAEGADFCMGSRFKGEIKPGAMPWKNRYIGNPALSAILRVLFRSEISDSHCGLRAIRREAYDQLRLSSDGMEFASEMVLKAELRGLKITEVPITLWPDGRGRLPHLQPWKDGFRHLFFMFLLSPSWLFMVPSALLFVFGASVLLLLLTTPDGRMVQIGGFGIGDHWAVVASSSLIISVQTFIGGLAALFIGFREGYLRPNQLQVILIRRSSLANWLATGLSLFAIGFIWAATIAAGWLEFGFGGVTQMRPMISAFTLMVIGIQASFGGFLLSAAAGNILRHGALAEPD